MATLELDDSAQFTLAYFTSDWVQSVDTLVLPRLRAIVENINVFCKEQHVVGLVEVRRSNKRVDSSTNVHVQRLEPSTFRSLCKHLKVTDLPACVLLDDQGQPLTPESLKALEGEIYWPHKSEENIEPSPSPWKVLVRLVQKYKAPATAWEALRPLWEIGVPSTDANFPKPADHDDSELYNLRKEALKLYETERFVHAMSKYVDVLLHNPTCKKSSFNLAVILQTIGETYFAVASMLRVVTLDDSDFVAHTVLRSVYFHEEPTLVVAGYHLIITTHGDSHVRAVHSLATLEGATTTKTAAPAYVAQVFDELADTFEDKVVARLEYRVPWHLVEALELVLPPGFAPKDSSAAPEWVVADVGCGTGLCGRLLRPHVKHIIGVDVSPLMIAKTRDEGSYDELHTSDIVPFLESCGDASLDLVIAADVWIYVGALDQVFELSARKLRGSTSWIAFSIELLPLEEGEDDAKDTGFRLAMSGRFQHSHKYITLLAFQYGFTIVVQHDVAVRKESGEPIPGRIYLLRRNVEQATCRR